MLNIQSIEQALSSVEEVGKGEITFKVNNIHMTLRILDPEEQIEVQRYASQVFDDSEESDQVTNLEFMEKFRVGLISYALVELNGQNFRNETVVETGEFLSNGTPITKPLSLVLRELISEKWSRDLRTSVFRKYGELVDEVERESEKAIQFKPTDYDAEIKRLEEQIELLQDRKAKEEQDLKSSLGVKEIIDIDRGIPVQVETPQEQIPEEPQVAPREPFFPPVMSPPVGPAQPTPPIVNQNEDSFFDPSDADAVQEANKRMAEARQRMAMGQPPQAPPSALNAIHGGEVPHPRTPTPSRVPPHAIAAEVGQDFDKPQAEALKEAQKLGQIGGVDVYRPGGPVEVIDSMDVMRRVANPPQPPSPKSSANPNFKPVKKY